MIHRENGILENLYRDGLTKGNGTQMEKEQVSGPNP
jgi:hypothetical protein